MIYLYKLHHTVQGNNNLSSYAKHQISSIQQPPTTYQAQFFKTNESYHGYKVFCLENVRYRIKIDTNLLRSQ